MAADDPKETFAERPNEAAWYRINFRRPGDGYRVANIIQATSAVFGIARRRPRGDRNCDSQFRWDQPQRLSSSRLNGIVSHTSHSQAYVSRGWLDPRHLVLCIFHRNAQQHC